MKMCKVCKDVEATEDNHQCFMCWEEGRYLLAELLAEFN